MTLKSNSSAWSAWSNPSPKALLGVWVVCVLYMFMFEGHSLASIALTCTFFVGLCPTNVKIFSPHHSSSLCLKPLWSAKNWTRETLPPSVSLTWGTTTVSLAWAPRCCWVQWDGSVSYTHFSECMGALRMTGLAKFKSWGLHVAAHVLMLGTDAHSVFSLTLWWIFVPYSSL